MNGTHAKIEKVTFAPIEFFDWDCLTIGALGWGQIQIANANVVKIVPKNSRKKMDVKTMRYDVGVLSKRDRENWREN